MSEPIPEDVGSGFDSSLKVYLDGNAFAKFRIRTEKDETSVLFKGLALVCPHTKEVYEKEYCQSFCNSKKCRYYFDCWKKDVDIKLDVRIKENGY